MAKPIKVAVIGGGCGGMAAAFELSRPEHKGAYQVTVFQEGWRLGGKGASGRGPSGRIEEHGLHVWLGFYDNAFRMMRECYAELAAHPDGSPYGDWREAFTPESDVGLFSPGEREIWQKWSAHFPPQPGLPGDPLDAGELLSLPRYMERAFALFRLLVLDSQVTDGEAPELEPPKAESLADLMSQLIDRTVFTGAAALAEMLGVMATAIAAIPDWLQGSALDFAERACAEMRRWLEDNYLAHDRQRHLWEIADMALANVVGVLRFGLLTDPRGLDAIEQYECREWLLMNGASERSVQSPFLRGLYDLALAYEDGDPEKPRLSAGQALRGTLRMFFGYRGALLWRMRAGMGDVIFAPLYECLTRRGVTFEFFHRLTNIGLPPGGPITPEQGSHVQSLTFDVQAEVVGGTAYEPLVEVAGRPCWPSHPHWQQLKGGAQLEAQGVDFESHWDRTRAGTETLNVTQDFDLVVLSVGAGAVPYVASELVDRDVRWKLMTEKVKTVATQAFQIWLTEDLEALGWQGPPYVVAGFPKPFDTWCDMAYVVPTEAWTDPPATSVYFCGVLREPKQAPDDADAGYPAQRKLEVKAAAQDYLEGYARLLWPKAYAPDGAFRWELLADAQDPGDGTGPQGPGRFATQYWRANVNPSDRYVLHVPGSTAYRISPLDMTYDNLTVAGDWTYSGFQSGCVEGAVMSGLVAAHALSGSPALEEIIAYDHP